MSGDKNLTKLWGNDEKRRAFVAAYRDWGVWFTTPELELTWFRYLLPDETIIIAMEYEGEVFLGYKEGYGLRTNVRYYVQKKGKCFSPGSNSSISAVAELLKDAKIGLQKNVK